MHKIVLISLTALTLLVSSAFAKEEPPVGGEPKDFSLAATTDFTLDNGLQVTLVPYGSTPKATVRLLTQTGRQDDGQLVGLAELSYLLLPEGTTKRTGLEISQAAATMGGDIESQSNINSSYLSIDVLSEFTPDAIELIAELALQAAINEDDLERVRNNRLRSLNVEKSQASTQANTAFFKALYGDHPYANVLPEEEALSLISTTTVRQFLTDHLTANRSHLYVAGKFDAKATELAIRSAFAAFSTGSERNIQPLPEQTKQALVFVPRENAPQSTLRLGLRVVDPTHPDYVALRLMNSLLGGSFSSRITSNIREDKGYTYSPFSSVSPYINSALWYQSADVTSESTAASLKEILKEIERLRQEPPSEEELQGIKRYAAGLFVLRNSSRSNILGQLWFYKNHGLPRSALENHLSTLDSITAEKISEMAKKYLTPANMTLVVVGDEASVVPQLKREPLLAPWL